MSICSEIENKKLCAPGVGVRLDLTKEATNVWGIDLYYIGYRLTEAT